MLPIEQLNSFAETSREATRQLVETALHGQEKLIRVNIDAIQDFIKTGGAEVKETWAEMSRDNQLTSWPQSFVGSIQRSTALNLSLIEITRRLHQELTCAVEDNLRTMRNGSLEAVEQFTAMAKTVQVPTVQAATTVARRSRSAERDLQAA